MSQGEKRGKLWERGKGEHHKKAIKAAVLHGPVMIQTNSIRMFVGFMFLPLLQKVALAAASP